MLRKPCRKPAFQISGSRRRIQCKPQVVIHWMMTIKWNAGQPFHCFQMVPPVQLESWSLLGKPQWSCSIQTEVPKPSAGSSSCPPAASVTPEAARPQRTNQSGTKTQCFPCQHAGNTTLWRPSSFHSWTLPWDPEGRGSGFLMEFVKLLLLPLPSRWDVDIGVDLIRNTINTINIYTGFGEVCKRQGLHKASNCKTLVSRQFPSRI